MSVTILAPRVWRTIDRVLAAKFPRRKPTIPPASWLGELMERRMGAVILCHSCLWNYGDAVARFGYAKHPEIRSKGGRCDGCQRSYDLLPVLIAEEKRGLADTTRAALDREHQRRVAPVPERFRA